MGSNPRTPSHVTLLPEPDSPTIPRLSPGAISRWKLSRARTHPCDPRKETERFSMLRRAKGLSSGKGEAALSRNDVIGVERAMTYRRFGLLHRYDNKGSTTALSRLWRSMMSRPASPPERHCQKQIWRRRSQRVRVLKSTQPPCRRATARPFTTASISTSSRDRDNDSSRPSQGSDLWLADRHLSLYAGSHIIGNVDE